MKKIFSYEFVLSIVIVVLSILAVIIVIDIIKDNNNMVEKSDKVFILVYEDLRNDIDVYVHIDTKVMYMCDAKGNRRVFEIMLDEFGKPLLYKGDL